MKSKMIFTVQWEACIAPNMEIEVKVPVITKGLVLAFSM